MKQTLTEKNLKKLLRQTKPFTFKRMYYGLLAIGTIGYCFKCNRRHIGRCNIK